MTLTLLKFSLEGTEGHGEVRYFFRLSLSNTIHTAALVLPYSPLDPNLLALSHNTLYSCERLPEARLTVINVKSIKSVVAMIPHKVKLPGRSFAEERWFVVEKPGLDVANMGGIVESTLD